MKYLVLFLCLPILSASCRKEKGDVTVPVITLSLPTNNQVYTSGQTVNIKGTLADNDLHEAKITITNNADGGVMNTIYLGVHGVSTYNMNENWTSVAAAPINATVTVEAADYTGNRSEQKIAIRINP
jgi:VCBS repeat-containing protein